MSRCDCVILLKVSSLLLFLLLLKPYIARCDVANGSDSVPTPLRNFSGKHLTKFTHNLVDGSRYDRHFRPIPPSGGPTDVYVRFHIDSFGPINVMRMEFSMEMVLHLRWVDRRLRFSGYEDRIVLSQMLDKVWRPDVFFQNAKSIGRHDLPSLNFLLWLWPNGTLLFSQKLQLRLPCPMNLKDFPFDVQTCAVKMSSFGMSTDDLLLHWINKDSSSGIGAAGVALTRHISRFLHLYYPPLCNYTTGTSFSVLTGRNFSYLKANFTLKRRQSSYLVNEYLPSIFIVLVTWSSFAIDYNAAPARVSLSILSLLALLTDTAAMAKKIPPVSYITALGIWHISCIAFIHLSLLEYMAINLLKRHQKASTPERRQQQIRQKCKFSQPTRKEPAKGEATCSPLMIEDNASAQTVLGVANLSSGGSRFHLQRNWRLTPANLDLIFLFSYPTAFAMFNVLYWCFIIPRSAVHWD